MSVATQNRFSDLYDDLAKLTAAVDHFVGYPSEARKVAWPHLRARVAGFEGRHDVKVEFGESWAKQVEADS